jgi:hypothetical protein
MGDIINSVQFDALFIQYYDTPACSAREWVSSNPRYGVSANTENASGFKENFDALVASLPASKSNATKLYIGLLGSRTAGLSGDYLDPTSEVAPLIEAYFCNPYFGGIMIFEAEYAEKNVDTDGKTFYEGIKDILVSDSTNTQQFTCATTGTPTTQTPSPTAGSGAGAGAGAGGEQMTIITMTLCPSSPGSFSTPIIYGNPTARSSPNHISVLYSSSYPTALSLATAATTTVSDFPSATSSTTTAITRAITSVYNVAFYAHIYADCIKETTILITTQIVRRADAPSTTYSLESSSTPISRLNSSNRTLSAGNNTSVTPTYSFNLSRKTPTPASNGSDCFVVVATMSVPVIGAPCSSTTPSASNNYAKRASGSAPLSIGSSLFFVFSLGVPGTLGALWYILGRILPQ